MIKNTLLGAALFAVTLGIVAFYPQTNATSVRIVDPIHPPTNANGQPVVDLVFVLDTTGSMSGLIDTAKRENLVYRDNHGFAQPTPEIRIGLVGYRDRGDDYVTKTIDLSADLDSVYASLMDFQAGGGGDMPESVNAGLTAALDDMSWSQRDQAYQVIFLVGDAPPHTDYQDEAQYPEILAEARQRGIIVNAIQCGGVPATLTAWNAIAELGNGSFFQVEQSGSAVAYSTPYDAELAALSARLDDSRIYYGSEEERDEMAAKQSATEKLSALASDEAKARRGVFNLSEAGRYNRLGKKELIGSVAAGEVSLADIPETELPAAIRAMAPAEQAAYIEDIAAERKEVEERMRELAVSRDDYIKQKIDEDGGAEDSLDKKLYETIARQAEAEGLEYSEGPAY